MNGLLSPVCREPPPSGNATRCNCDYSIPSAGKVRGVDWRNRAESVHDLRRSAVSSVLQLPNTSPVKAKRKPLLPLNSKKDEKKQGREL